MRFFVESLLGRDMNTAIYLGLAGLAQEKRRNSKRCSCFGTGLCHNLGQKMTVNNALLAQVPEQLYGLCRSWSKTIQCVIITVT